MSKTAEKRIILLASPEKPEARVVGRQLLTWLNERAEVVADNVSGDNAELDITDLPTADFMIVLGGDGTILSVVRDMGTRQIPIIGVNMGKLGFLAEFTVDEFHCHFDEILSRAELTTQRSLLHGRITGPHRPTYSSIIVNEVAVTAGPPFRMIEVDVSIGAEHLAICAGDGVIIATPTGSTAYNLSAGGPILSVSLQGAVITPLATHSLSFRPMVIGLDKPIVIRCRDSYHSVLVQDDQPVNATVVAMIDGQINTPLSSEDELTITRFEHPFRLVHNPQQSHWHLLSTKLNWGALPNYDRKPKASPGR